MCLKYMILIFHRSNLTANKGPSENACLHPPQSSTLWTSCPIVWSTHPGEESVAWLECRGSGQTQGVSMTEFCSFGVGPFTPLSYTKPNWCLPLIESTIPTLQAPVAPFSWLFMTPPYPGLSRIWDRQSCVALGQGHLYFSCQPRQGSPFHTAKSWSIGAWQTPLASLWWLPVTHLTTKVCEHPGGRSYSWCTLGH